MSGEYYVAHISDGRKEASFRPVNYSPCIARALTYERIVCILRRRNLFWNVAEVEERCTMAHVSSVFRHDSMFKQRTPARSSGVCSCTILRKFQTIADGGAPYKHGGFPASFVYRTEMGIK
jgi:hypothetical protein